MASTPASTQALWLRIDGEVSQRILVVGFGDPFVWSSIFAQRSRACVGYSSCSGDYLRRCCLTGFPDVDDTFEGEFVQLRVHLW